MHRHQVPCNLEQFSECQEWSRISYKSDSPGVYLFDEISAAEICFAIFFRSSYELFLIFPYVSPRWIVSSANIPNP